MWHLTTPEGWSVYSYSKWLSTDCLREAWHMLSCNYEDKDAHCPAIRPVSHLRPYTWCVYSKSDRTNCLTHETSTWQKSKLCVFKHPPTGQSVWEVDLNFGSVWVWVTEKPTLETCRGGGFKTPFNHPTGTCAGLLLMPLILTVIPLVFSCIPQLPLLLHCDWTMGDNYSI